MKNSLRGERGISLIIWILVVVAIIVFFIMKLVDLHNAKESLRESHKSNSSEETIVGLMNGVNKGIENIENAVKGRALLGE